MLNNPQITKMKLLEWVREYFRGNGPTCTAVLGISGGKDSSICAALLAEALGKERVLGLLLPNGEQPDIEDAREVVRTLGIRSIEINISSAFNGLKQSLNNVNLSKDAIINMPPRLRMATLYAVAQSVPEGGRVCNTCNRSEDYIGYSTKFGDMAGDFSLLSNLLVSEVLQIGDLLPLPARLVHKTPSDGLSGMSDEDKIGFTYEELDHYILTGEASEDTKVKIERLHRMNLHKLKPMPAFDNLE